MNALRDAISIKYNNDAFGRVIYSESHDEVANGNARVPQEIDPHNARSWFAQKRSTLAAALVFTAPGIPMLFQGQEVLQGEWLRDDVVVVMNFSTETRGDYRIGFPATGKWQLRFNSDAAIYSPDFGNAVAGDVETDDDPQDGFQSSTLHDIAPYPTLIFIRSA